MDNNPEFLAYLHELAPAGIVGPEVDEELFLVHWGYKIYRTYYGPGSEKKKVVKAIRNVTNGVENRLNDLEGAEDVLDDVAKIMDQFRLDARSLPASLDGLTTEDIRQSHLKGSGGQPMRGIQGDNWGTWRMLNCYKTLTSAY